MCFRIGHFDLSEVVALTRRRAASWLAAGAGHGGGFWLFGPFLLLCFALFQISRGHGSRLLKNNRRMIYLSKRKSSGGS